MPTPGLVYTNPIRTYPIQGQVPNICPPGNPPDVFSLAAASAGNTGQVVVSATEATQIVIANPLRRTILITNLGANDVFIGFTQGVKTNTGQLLPGVKGASLSLDINTDVWAIAAGAQTVSFTELLS